MRMMTKLISLLALAILPALPLAAQAVRSVDPNAAMAAKQVNQPSADEGQVMAAETKGPIDSPDAVVITKSQSAAVSSGAPAADAATYKKDDLIGAAEGVFGKGAKGLAELVEKILKDQGEPNAYIAGREASGAFVVGLRYGSGTMTHSIEGQKPVYWTGPSLGFDFGGDAAKVFVLVYNLYDGDDIYRRYPQVEGRAYFVGGLSGTYLRRGSVALIPIRLGAGVRLGANVGYMKFSQKSKWLPF